MWRRLQTWNSRPGAGSGSPGVAVAVPIQDAQAAGVRGAPRSSSKWAVARLGWRPPRITVPAHDTPQAGVDALRPAPEDVSIPRSFDVNDQHGEPRPIVLPWAPQPKPEEDGAGFAAAGMGGTLGSMHSVLVADDHGIVREGLRRLLDAEEDLTVCGEASDGREVLEQVERSSPDCVVLDITHAPARRARDARADPRQAPAHQGDPALGARRPALHPERGQPGRRRLRAQERPGCRGRRRGARRADRAAATSARRGARDRRAAARRRSGASRTLHACSRAASARCCT